MEIALNDVNWNAMAVIVGVITVCGVLFWTPVRDYIGGLKMKQKRRGEIQHWYISRIVDMTEDAIVSNFINRDEATREVYEPLKRVFSYHKDLYPSETWLKERIEARMKNGAHDPVPLPKGKRKNLLGR